MAILVVSLPSKGFRSQLLPQCASHGRGPACAPFDGVPLLVARPLQVGIFIAQSERAVLHGIRCRPCHLLCLLLASCAEPTGRARTRTRRVRQPSPRPNGRLCLTRTARSEKSSTVRQRTHRGMDGGGAANPAKEVPPKGDGKPEKGAEESKEADGKSSTTAEQLVRLRCCHAEGSHPCARAADLRERGGRRRAKRTWSSRSASRPRWRGPRTATWTLCSLHWRFSDPRFARYACEGSDPVMTIYSSPHDELLASRRAP